MRSETSQESKWSVGEQRVDSAIGQQVERSVECEKHREEEKNAQGDNRCRRRQCGSEQRSVGQREKKRPSVRREQPDGRSVQRSQGEFIVASGREKLQNWFQQLQGAIRSNNGVLRQFAAAFLPSYRKNPNEQRFFVECGLERRRNIVCRRFGLVVFVLVRRGEQKWLERS